MSKRCLIDANLILRFILNDPPKQAEYVRQLLERSEEKALIVLDVVLMEVVFTLTSFYKYEKKEVIKAIRAFISLPEVSCDRALVSATLSIFEQHSLSIVDAYICASSQKANIPIETFDKKLLKVFNAL